MEVHHVCQRHVSPKEVAFLFLPITIVIIIIIHVIVIIIVITALLPSVCTIRTRLLLISVERGTLSCAQWDERVIKHEA